MVFAGDVAGLVGAQGGPDFPQQLFDWLQTNVHIDELFVFQRPLDPRPPPVSLISLGCRPNLTARARSYCEHYHAMDPINALMPHEAGAAGARVSSEQIADGTYRAVCFGHPGFSEKVSFWRPQPGGFLVASLYRTARAGSFTAAELATARGCIRLLFPLVETHQRLTRIPGAPRNPGESLLQSVENKLAALPKALPSRQLSVCARTIIGLTAKEIADDLGIRVSSVITHRRRAYERLDISNGAELARLLL